MRFQRWPGTLQNRNAIMRRLEPIVRAAIADTMLSIDGKLDHLISESRRSEATSSMAGPPNP